MGQRTVACAQLLSSNDYNLNAVSNFRNWAAQHLSAFVRHNWPHRNYPFHFNISCYFKTRASVCIKSFAIKLGKSMNIVSL